MKIFTKIKDITDALALHKKSNQSIGFVPTMGYLHDGHMELVHQAKSANDVVIVSIFVNPIQFGPNEDYAVYPRDIDRDSAMLQGAEVDYLFIPGKDEMYPSGFSTSVSVSGISEVFCGARRPGHFDGVCTVITKFFNILRPDNAYFGLKDYQQYLVVRKMVNDMNIPVKITGVPIVREGDGLALSSRNVYLSDQQRQNALAINKSFDLIQKMLDKGIRSVKEITDAAVAFISKEPLLEIDYLELADPETLEPVKYTDKPFVCMVAVKTGKVRLIDNKRFN